MTTILVIALAFLCFMGGYSNGIRGGREHHQITAVKAGHAHWVVDAEGKTTFVWNKPCTP